MLDLIQLIGYLRDVGGWGCRGASSKGEEVVNCPLVFLNSDYLLQKQPEVQRPLKQDRLQMYNQIADWQSQES
jgi:hypothetical protein